MLVAELQVERGRVHGSMHDCMRVWTPCVPAHASHISVALSDATLMRHSSAARLNCASC